VGSRKLKLVEPPIRPDIRREVEAVLNRRWEKSKPIRIFAGIAILAVVSWIVVALFSPTLKYQLAHAPSVGIAEDPVTGSIQCTLAPYWAARLGKRQLRSRQLSARGGEVYSEVAGPRVKISGSACLYMHGMLEF
jgi:hypothetical protein